MARAIDAALARAINMKLMSLVEENEALFMSATVAFDSRSFRSWRFTKKFLEIRGQEQAFRSSTANCFHCEALGQSENDFWLNIGGTASL